MSWKFWKEDEPVRDVLLENVNDILSRRNYLEGKLDSLIRDNMVVSSLEDWYGKLKLYIPDLTDSEWKFCKTYLTKKAFSGWERWREV